MRLYLPKGHHYSSKRVGSRESDARGGVVGKNLGSLAELLYFIGICDAAQLLEAGLAHFSGRTQSVLNWLYDACSRGGPGTRG